MNCEGIKESLEQAVNELNERNAQRLVKTAHRDLGINLPKSQVYRNKKGFTCIDFCGGTLKIYGQWGYVYLDYKPAGRFRRWHTVYTAKDLQKLLR